MKRKTELLHVAGPIACVIVWLAEDWVAGALCIGIWLITSLVWLFVHGDRIRTIVALKEDLGRADDELDEYDHLRRLILSSKVMPTKAIREFVLRHPIPQEKSV